MRAFIGVFILLISWGTNSQSEIILREPTVDKRVELLSIVFRLANSKEYSSNKFPKYVENIEDHFGQYRNHKLIRYIKWRLRTKGVSYDAVMKMATSISQPPEMTAILPFSENIPERRWGKKRATKFLKLLNRFYFDANCEAFFKENEGIYRTASERFLKVFKELDLEWYQNFYGENPKGEFRIINGIGNGGANYGPKVIFPDGKEIIYAIMGTWSVDTLGLPNYELNSYFPVLLHEFNHSFVNHIVEKYHSELRKSGRIIFPKLRKEMKKQAYGSWETMYAESVVRASVIKYLIDHNADKKIIVKERKKQLKRGFLWTDKLVLELERYDNNRSKYPTLESFMPEIVKFFNKTEIEIDELIRIKEENESN